MKREKNRLRKVFSFAILFMLLFYAFAVYSKTKKVKTKKIGKRKGIICWRETHKTPRKMCVSIIEIDLSNKKLEPIACVTEDPDGDGPAEATLAIPKKIVKTSKVVAAVNANAFAVVGEKVAPTTVEGKLNRYKDGMPSTMTGWVISNGEVKSSGGGQVAFCVMKDGTVKISHDIVAADVKEAVAGFQQIINDGKVIVDDAVLHPRTGVGVDKNGEKMWLVIIDGRQNGYSEGASTKELAEIMLKLGSWDAINFDGGGSSIMFFAKTRKAKQVNKTPYGIIRPIPVMIGIKLLKKARTATK